MMIRIPPLQVRMSRYKFSLFWSFACSPMRGIGNDPGEYMSLARVPRVILSKLLISKEIAKRAMLRGRSFRKNA